MKNTARKTLALALAIVLCLSLVPMAASAEEQTPFNVVSIGDSTLNGYTLDDYGKFSDAKWAPLGNSYFRHWGGFLDYASKSSAPYLMRDYLQTLMPDREVTITNLALEGQRTDEVRKLLDPSFEADDFDPWHIARYNDVFNQSKPHLRELYPDIDFDNYTINDFYYDNVKNADLIIFDCCSNNFGTFISGKLQDALAGKQINVYSPADVVGRLSPEIREAAQKISETVTETLSAVLPAGIVTDLASTFAYAFCDMCANYTWDIQKFYEINPDVKIIAVAPMSIMDGLVAKFSGIEIDLGNIWATMIDLANTYITTFDPNNTKVLYAELPEGVECFATAFARGELTWYFRQIVMENFYGTLGYTAADCDKFVEANNALAAQSKLPEAERDQAVIAANEAILAPWDSVFELFIKCAGVNVLDFDLAFNVIETSGLEPGTKAIVRDALEQGLTFEQLDDGQKTMLHVYARFIVDGIGTHPSKQGAAQKFKAIKNAYDKGITAVDCAGDVITTAGLRASVGIINTLKAPIVDAISKVFSIIDLSDFFNAIFEQLSQFLLTLMPWAR